MTMLKQLQHILHTSNCSCVIANGDKIESFYQRGIKDLYELLRSNRSLLEGATIADKVVGKGAAALMILGKVGEVHADVISTPALNLLRQYGLPVSFNQETDRIMNRNKNGLCPVETLCLSLESPEEMLTEIRNFINKITNG